MYSKIKLPLASLLKISLPIMVSQIAQMGITTSDVMMLGQLGADYLAGLSIAAGIWAPLMLFCIGVLYAVTAMSAHCHGARKPQEIGMIARQAAWIALTFTCVLIPLLFCTQPILTLFRVDPQIAPKTSTFLMAITPGIPALFAFQVLRCVAEGMGKTRPVMVISLLGLGVNVLLNYLLIYGHWGFPRLEIRGSGFASSITQWFMLSMILIYFKSDYHFKELQIFQRLQRPDFKRLGAILKIGVPNGLSLLAEVSAFSLTSLLLARFGSVIISAHQIALNISGLTFMVPMSLGLGLTAVVGQALGAGQPELAHRTGRIGIGLAGLFMGLMAFLLYTLRFYIPLIYNHEPEVVALASQLLILAAIYQIPDGVQVATNGTLRGYKDTAIPMLIVITAYWVISLPLGSWLCFYQGFGAAGLWIGLIAGLSFASVCLLWRFTHIKSI